MCRCTPLMRTPFCGKPGCEWPEQVKRECAHENVAASVRVGRLSHDDGGPITGYVADVTVKCAGCGLPFRFLGLELRAPMEPALHERFEAIATYKLPPRARN